MLVAAGCQVVGAVGWRGVAATGRLWLMPAPIYTSENCRPAYQLRWSLALFCEQDIPPSSEWLELLKTAVERDAVRILEHNAHENVRFFLLSTRPDVSPPQIVKSVKGRLQNLIQSQAPHAFRRNFRLTSVGDATRVTIEAYVRGQLGHHRMADERVDQMLADFQFEFPDVDLSIPQRSAHGEYLCNLHVVLVQAERWNEVRADRLQSTADMILKAARAKEHRLSRLSLLADHMHFTIGVPYESTPAEIALGYMNNVAFTHGMTALFSPSYFLGTFGEYAMNAARR